MTAKQREIIAEVIGAFEAVSSMLADMGVHVAMVDACCLQLENLREILNTEKQEAEILEERLREAQYEIKCLTKELRQAERIHARKTEACECP